ncbi:lysophospholipid acyltransferase family protein [Nannocystis sp. SCPEA4]|uniref:lysophospholipid acyltransferase family protein n=1 Tax=Nannocystis sp. SCPEA4 TaxID=2996787 RepID=UPI002270314B|nr:lysophospholipid acyltransferase family protein [Nannocystis sp. SCPEA4]
MASGTPGDLAEGVCRSALRSAVAGFDVLSRYHRCEVRGVENVPDGPALIVANHNGGLNPVDGLFLVEYYRQRGYDRPIFILAHDILFRIKRVARLLESVGIIRARKGQARSLLEAGHKVLVFPGGDVESMRPFRDRGRIVLAQRQGFARLALRAGVPIVPVVSAGSHETMIVLTRGHRLARLIQTHKWARISSLPIILAAPWGLLLGPTCALPYLPLPSKITFQVGAPISLTDSACCEVEAAERAPTVYDKVEQTMQSMLDSLYEERLLPIFG